MSRERLVSRRRNATATIEWMGQHLDLSVGFTRDGRPLEVFCRCRKPGSDLDALIDDAAVLASRLLQHGDTLDAIARGLGRDHNEAPASIVAKLIDEAQRIAAEAV